MEKYYKEIQLLNCINKIDPPPFLYSRIMQKINRVADLNYNTGIARSIVLSLFLLLLLNLMVVGSSTKGEADQNTIVEELNLMPANTLYYE